MHSFCPPSQANAHWLQDRPAQAYESSYQGQCQHDDRKNDAFGSSLRLAQACLLHLLTDRPSATDSACSHVSRLELFSSGQKLKVPSASTSLSGIQQHSQEACALQALLASVLQEAHAAAVHTAARSAQQHAQTARDAKATVAGAYGAVMGGPVQAQTLVHETMAAGEAAAKAAELAGQVDLCL